MVSDCATESQCPIILPLPTRGLAKLDMNSTVIVRTHVPGAPHPIMLVWSALALMD